MKVIDMIRNLSQRNAIVNSCDVQVIFSELDKSNYRIGELQKDNETLRAMMREVEIQRDGLVAENVALKVANKKLISEQQAAWPIGLLDSFIAEHEPESPTTDAAISEIGARAIRECADALLANDDIGVEHEYPLMREYAKKLRGGGA
ncbi:hypothetical protein WCT79_20325 [Pectobacterium carotovorum]|uniref:hypothetical protein n=1 Tax=Pectobacterium carotovorum TaxID=554 RepID=UPI003019C7D5